MTAFFSYVTEQTRSRPWLIPLIDTLLVILAFILAYILRYRVQLLRPVYEFNNSPFEPYIPYLIIYALWLYINYRGNGLYRQVRGRRWIDEVYLILTGVTNATVIMMAISFIFQPLVFSRLMMIFVAAMTIILLSLARVVNRTILARQRAQGIGIQRVLVVGAGEIGHSVLRTLYARKEFGYEPVGYLDDNPERGNINIGRFIGLGGLDKLEQAIREHDIDVVMITLAWKHHNKIMELIQIARNLGLEVSVVPDVFQLNLRQVQIQTIDGIPLLQINGYVPIKASHLLKRATDLGIIVLLSPFLIVLFALVSIAIKLDSPGPILYRARRVGENGREFDMLKFRSMVVNADQQREELVKTQGLDPRHPKMKDDPRVTRVGSFIRRLSLDEIPNLINVFNGQMSLVGPRPPTPDEVALYEPWHLQRLSVKPGLTGLWQVSGRSEVEFEEMCLLDIYYIENWSMQLDAEILFLTIPRVLLRQGAY